MPLARCSASSGSAPVDACPPAAVSGARWDGTTSTSVPLIDASGSTIALVNAANVDAGPVTTYTYDPAGNPTVSGTANDWPFQYQGMEKEFTDPGPYYYPGGLRVMAASTR